MTRWTEIMKRFLLNSMLRVAAILLVAGFAMILVRYGPGFETDDRDLDPSLSEATRNAMHNQRRAEGRLIEYARDFAAGALHGDFGESKSLGVPVRELIAERGPATLRILAVGTSVAWLAGLLWAIALAIFRAPAFAGISSLASACLLCLPTAAIAALMLNANWPAEMVLAVALVPKVFQVSRGLIEQAVDHGEILAARARGLRTGRLLGWYVLPRIAGPMLAWLAATMGLAIGAVVPIEVICDVPGLGQLAWKAALARDLPVLVVLTLMVAVIIQVSSSATSLVAGSLRGRQA
jgi:peptide/nickel transport system permease protein